jgi:SAM-dependent methyltransferase
MAEFTTRDPARADFWDERFARGFVPWDAQGIPLAFEAFLAAHGGIPGPRVLVPGCGSGYEVAALDHAGFEVVALDYSAAAIARAAAVLGAELCGRAVKMADFFAFDAEPFDWIYERAFLAALPLAQWPHWAAGMQRLLRAGGLLAGYFVFDDEVPEKRRGPPFVATRAELDGLLRGFRCETCEAVPPEQSLPVFAGREWWMTWRRVPA